MAFVVSDNEFCYAKHASKFQRKEAFDCAKAILIFMEKCYENSFFDRAYDFFGVHLLERSKNGYKYVFRLPSVSANQIYLAGDFAVEPIPLTRNSDGTWELIYESDIPLEGMIYEYKIFTGNEVLKASDPFSLYSDKTDYGNTSIILNKDSFTHSEPIFSVGDTCAPINVFMSSLSSLNERYRLGKELYLNYRELAIFVYKHIEKMNYTHIELSDFIGDGCFCPCAKYGYPNDVKFFVDFLHSKEKGIIIDFHLDQRIKNIFAWESKEFSAFFISAVMYWFREFHIDGIKFTLKDFKAFGEEQYLLNLFGELNVRASSEFGNDVFLIADDICFEHLLTHPVEDGGFGFDLKWNRGWMLFMADIDKKFPRVQCGKNSQILFSLKHSYFENFILPFLPCETSTRFFRLLLGFMIMHPGKKMMLDNSDTFFSEELNQYIAELNGIYLKYEALWELDYSANGIRIVLYDDSMIAFKRFSSKGAELFCVFNFSLSEIQHSFEGLDSEDYYIEIFNINGKMRCEALTPIKGELRAKLSPLSFVIFERIGKSKEND